MRKLFISIFAFIAAVVSANAQGYIAGSVSLGGGFERNVLRPGYSSEGSYYSWGNFSFGIAPDFGWQFSDKITVGARLHISNQVDLFKDKSPLVKEKTKKDYFVIDLNPYFRYGLGSFGKFHFFAEAGAEIGLNIENCKVRNTDNGDMKQNIKAGVGPNWALDFGTGFLFDINDRLSLVANVTVLQIVGAPLMVALGPDNLNERYEYEGSRVACSFQLTNNASLGFIYKLDFKK